MTASIDMPTDDHARAAQFWCQVSGSTLSAARGERDQFATLLPPDGDAHLRVQNTGRGGTGVHEYCLCDRAPR